jgi:hypothetical protein
MIMPFWWSCISASMSQRIKKGIQYLGKYIVFLLDHKNRKKFAGSYIASIIAQLTHKISEVVLADM